MDQIVGLIPGGKYADMDLRGYHMAHGNYEGCNFNGCNLSGMDLTGTNLNRCSLQGANMTGTYLKDANMYGIDIACAMGIVGGIYRRDGHVFFGVLGHGDELMIKAGCRWFDMERARQHWGSRENVAILDCLQALADTRVR